MSFDEEEIEYFWATMQSLGREDAASRSPEHLKEWYQFNTKVIFFDSEAPVPEAEIRAAIVIDQMKDKIPDIREIRAILREEESYGVVIRARWLCMRIYEFRIATLDGMTVEKALENFILQIITICKLAIELRLFEAWWGK
jgi:hypothetical protein